MKKPIIEHHIYEVDNGWMFEISLMEHWKGGQNKVLYRREDLTEKEALLLMDVGWIFVGMINNE